MKKDARKKILHRLKILEGQIGGLVRMVESGKYCINIITQSLAIKHALSGVEDLILQNHLETCVVDQMKAGRNKKSVKEILAIYRLSKKK